MVRGGAGVVLVACLATGVDAFSGISLPLKGHRYPTYCYKDSSAIPLAALKMQATPKDFASDSHALSRRIAIGIFGACTLQALPVGAEDAEIPSKAGPAVCDKVLGCEIKGQLTPPKRVYRDIFEEVDTGGKPRAANSIVFLNTQEVFQRRCNLLLRGVSVPLNSLVLAGAGAGQGNASCARCRAEKVSARRAANSARSRTFDYWRAGSGSVFCRSR